MQRRSFIKRGLLGGVLLTGATLMGIGLMPGDASVKPAGTLFTIEARNFPVLVAVAARVLSGSTASPSDIAMKVDQALRYTSLESQKDINAALMLLENALTGLFTRGKVATFTELDEKAQDAALYGWRDSKLVLLRSAYHALRKLCLAAHYATPAGWPDTGYPGPSVPKAEPSAITERGPLVTTAAVATPPSEVMP